MFISVSEAAKKFNISKRRVQFLCEQGRIDGATRVSGVWILPKDAQKPVDARKKDRIGIIDNKSTSDLNKLDTEHLTAEQVCEILSVSSATVKNWVRLGKMLSDDGGKTFRTGHIKDLIKEIKDSESDKLKKRRNKKNATGKKTYKDYIKNHENINLVEKISDEIAYLSEEELKIVIIHFAISLYNQCCNVNKNIEKYIKKNAGEDDEDTFDCLVMELMENVDFEKVDLSKINLVFKYQLKYVPFEDTLGFVYLSLRDLSDRKQDGAYYTPADVVNTLIDGVFRTIDIENKSICDPCCGTGNFIIGLLKRNISIKNIFGQDIDKISVVISKINVLLLNPHISIEELNQHLMCGNTLLEECNSKFSVILGNPPWGSSFSKQERIDFQKIFYSAQQKSIESYDLFIEKGLKMLEDNGCLAFVLPEAVLNVSSHEKIRELILKNASFKFLYYLGNVFSGVQCPSVILGICKDGVASVKGCHIVYEKDNFVIDSDRKITSSQFSLNINNEEYECMQQIDLQENVKFLRDNAKFALGIVTGENKKYIKKDFQKGLEPILKGSDICRYNIKNFDKYIEFVPDKFQQVAPVEFYRAKEKLLYRFISEVPVFAYDDKQTLSLNSCNIVIPQIEGLEMKYVLAILNSSVAAYYFCKKFNSVKLLRSHIEQMPIPFVSKKIQSLIVNKVEQIMNSPENAGCLYKELDQVIMNLFNLSEKHRSIIEKALKNKNLFLTF